MKSAETSVQIFKCHFDPFSIKWSKNLFCEIIFIFNIQTSGEISSDLYRLSWVDIWTWIFSRLYLHKFLIQILKVYA